MQTGTAFEFNDANTAPISSASITDSAGGTTLIIGPGASLDSAAANGQFDIVIRYTGDAKYQAAFTQAAARWSQIITGDIADVVVSTQNRNQYNLPAAIDDLYIDAEITPIDGPGQILGQAGPVLVRPTSQLAYYGQMEFDSADVAGMFANGTWTSVILHEMGHILGIGTLWSALHLKNGAGDYIGAHALAEYRTLTGNASAASIPIEHDGGSGTAGAHWDEDTFKNELMTGYAEAPGVPMPISRMTIGSLEDMGYTVNYSAADPYSLPGVTPPPPPPPPAGPTGVTGDNNDNVLTGTSGNDTMTGLGGNDTMTGLGGNDSINGGTGDDTAVFSGNLASYAVTDFGTKITTSGPDGNDTLLSIEHLRFADGTINLADGNPLFDTAYYDRTNLDVFHANVNALAHYNGAGWHEGRDPNAFFDTSFYLATNPDVKASGVNPLTQFDQTGWKLGRDPSPNFDTKLYLLHNPDVAAAGIDPLVHFLTAGMAEGRVAYAAIGSSVNGFDAEYYLMNNPDVAAAGIDPLQHFMSTGWKEGRNPNAFFDTKGYLAHYQDIAAAGINPLVHYETAGWKEGRDPSAGFDTLHYLQTYTDVANAHINPLDHYINNGIYEGRSTFADGVWH
jgi:Ca2+-binding RTX toxin-like protein